MPGERRGAGRWRRDDRDRRKTNRRQCRQRAKRAGERPGRWALGRTDGLDGADVDGPRKGGQRRQMVQPDRQGLSRTDPATRRSHRSRPTKERRGGSCDGRRVRGTTWKRTWSDSAKRCGPGATARRRSAGTTSPSRGARRSGRWGYRRCETGWCKRRCEWCWNRSSSTSSPSTATAFAPDGDARTRCGESMSCSRRATVHVVDADLKSYFDTIPHDRLLALVGQKVSDGRVLALIEAFLKQGVLDGLQRMDARAGHPARGGDQSAAEQHLPQPAGPSDGRAGVRDGALRRRLRDPVSKPRGSGRGLGGGAATGRQKPA